MHGITVKTTLRKERLSVMYLKRISIIGFKNIQESNLELSKGINCFIGHNGVGKTIILMPYIIFLFARVPIVR